MIICHLSISLLYTNLNILQNRRFIIKVAIVPGKKVIAIASVFYPVGVAKNQKQSLVIILNQCGLQLLK